MLALRQHPLLNAELQAAFDWYEEQRLGLGWEFKDDFLAHFRNLPRDAPLHGIRFADVRRLNLDRSAWVKWWGLVGASCRSGR